MNTFSCEIENVPKKVMLVLDNMESHKVFDGENGYASQYPCYTSIDINGDGKLDYAISVLPNKPNPPNYNAGLDLAIVYSLGEDYKIHIQKYAAQIWGNPAKTNIDLGITPKPYKLKTFDGEFNITSPSFVFYIIEKGAGGVIFWDDNKIQHQGIYH